MPGRQQSPQQGQQAQRRGLRVVDGQGKPAKPPEQRAAASGKKNDPRGGAPAPQKPSADEARKWPPARKLEYLRYHIGDCQRCRLAGTRTTIVFGSGNPEAQVMFVGEAPGADEDRQGIPFVGAAGQRLNRMLRELELERHHVYIANVLKCRPPRNRDPRPDEVNVCSKFLEAQIRAIQPRVLIALGRHAGMLMLRKSEMTLREMRAGKWIYEQPAAQLKIPLFITYHPSYVLRRESDARRQGGNANEAHSLVVDDLRKALSVIRASSNANR